MVANGEGKIPLVEFEKEAANVAQPISLKASMTGIIPSEEKGLPNADTATAINERKRYFEVAEAYYRQELAAALAEKKAGVEEAGGAAPLEVPLLWTLGVNSRDVRSGK